MTDAEAFAAMLQDLLGCANEVDEAYDDRMRVETFEEAGVLTRDQGLIVRTSEGHEYQVTVVRSR